MDRVRSCWLPPLVFLGILVGGNASAEVPKSGWVVWMSDRADGRHEVYLKRAGSSDATRLTYSGGKDPLWSPDGRWIAYHHTQDDTTHVIRWDRSEDKKISDGVPELWMHDGSGVLCGKDTGYGGSGSYYLVDPDTGTSKLLFKKNDFAHLQDASLDPGGITHDGRWLVAWVFGLFGQGYTADNGTFTTPHATVVLDLQDKAKLFYFGPGCTSATPPSGDWIYHVSRVGSTMPDIFRMKIGDLMTRASYQLELGNADADWGHEYMPSISNDGGWMAYAASTGCHDWWTCDYEIFVHKLEAGPGSRERLTFNKANDSFPSLYVGELWSSGSEADAGPPGDRGPAPDVGAGPGGESSGCGIVGTCRGTRSLSSVLGLMVLLALLMRASRCRRW